MAHDDFIDTFAVNQHGLVTRRQLLDAGVSRQAIQKRLTGGRLRALHAGVYVVRSHPLSWSARVLGACFAAGPDAAASHRSAGALHGLPDVPPVVEVSVGVARAPCLRGALVHRAAELTTADVEVRDGIPRTRMARTLIDLAAVVPPPILETAVDDALSRRLVTCSYLERRLDALGRKGRKGAGALARLLAERPAGNPRHQSTFERWLFALLDHAGVPPPVPQYEVVLPDGGRARLDSPTPITFWRSKQTAIDTTRARSIGPGTTPATPRWWQWVGESCP